MWLNLANSIKDEHIHLSIQYSFMIHKVVILAQRMGFIHPKVYSIIYLSLLSLLTLPFVREILAHAETLQNRR